MSAVHPAPPDRRWGATALTGNEDFPEQANVLYLLRPAHSLPVLDLSISFKSRLLSQRAVKTLDSVIRRHSRFIFFTYIAGTIGYVIFLVLELHASRWVAVFVSIVSFPATIIAISYLRYNVAKLLFAATYEVCFFTVINTVTFGVCAVALGDIRCIALVPPWLGVETNILVDANVRALRRLVWSTLIAMALLLLSIPLVTFGLVHGITNIVLWRHHTHEVTAFAVVLNGITTLAALMFRNVFRNRSKLRHKLVSPSAAAEVSCVSYRCTLRFVPTTDKSDEFLLEGSDRVRGDEDLHCSKAADSEGPVQELRYTPILGVIDAGNTVIPLNLLHRLDKTIGSKRVVWLLLRVSIFLTLAATPIDRYLQDAITVDSSGKRPWPHFFALGVTSAFFGYSVAHYQRQLLRSIITSFDYLFLEIQSLIVHLALCDFFRWSERAVPLVALSWIWIHWVLFADALTPTARQMLGIKVHMFAHVAGFCLGTSILVLYLMIFSDDSADIHDRVLYKRTFESFELEVRVSPMFYSNFITVLGWAVNFFWRVCTYGASDLVMVDGPVVYTNYLRLTNRRQSVAWSQSPRPSNKSTLNGAERTDRHGFEGQ